MTEPSEIQEHLQRVMETFARMEKILNEMELDLQVMREHAAFIEKVLLERIAAEREAKDGQV